MTAAEALALAARPMFGMMFSDGTYAGVGTGRTSNPYTATVFTRDATEAATTAKRMGCEAVDLPRMGL